ncbi:hypothetical protein B0T11DRAFT_302796 [Plectosphaerella cucumerina]|uniref:Uncharacterized protein n=1 Tax=Plectosphaerella cucumerina TaxID=40658 RepID=A0A8K0T4H4_9PEZI|nr:hypothetical protein B0T11DRAFT_302796 [Plectosphaerella cucumerina]
MQTVPSWLPGFLPCVGVLRSGGQMFEAAPELLPPALLNLGKVQKARLTVLRLMAPDAKISRLVPPPRAPKAPKNLGAAPVRASLITNWPLFIASQAGNLGSGASPFRRPFEPESSG